MAGQGVDYDVDGTILDDVDDVGGALPGLDHGGNGKADGLDHLGGALGGV